MGRKRKRTCVHCQTKYIPDPYNHYHQNYCGKTENCRKESNRAASCKYRRKSKNRTPEKKKAESERVKKWQRANPGYKRRQRREKKRKKIIEGFVLRHFAPNGKGAEIDVLRHFAFRQHVELKGLVSHLFDALRDDIGVIENRLYDIGLSVSGFPSEKKISNRSSVKKENSNDEGTSRSGPPPPVTGTFFVGGPSPGP